MKGGLMAELGGAPAEELDDLDDYDDDLAPLGDEGSNAAFDAYAETALGSNDPAKLSALREAIRSVLEESGMGAMGDLGADPLEGL